MRRGSVVLPLVLIAAASYGAVRKTEYPLGKRMAVVWSSDDMLDVYRNDPVMGNRWTNFIQSAYLAVSNNIRFCPAVITGPDRMTDQGWIDMQDMMDEGILFPHNHSYSHPVNITNYYNEYILSQELMDSKLTYPQQYTYKGKSYNNVFIQWGGCTNIDFSISSQYIASNNFIASRGYNSGATNWPVWSEETQTFITPNYNGMFRLSVSGYASFDAITNAFNTSYSNRVPWVYMGHAWTSGENVYGTNTIVWHEIFEYIGNRPEVWYADLTGLMQYRYLYAVADVEMSVSGLSEKIVSVRANAAEREKYGLSYPMTYAIDVDNVYHFGGYTAYYRDEVETGWTEMVEVTTNDYFTGQNCYLNAGTNVLVSQGFPQTTDSFEIKLVPRKQAAGFFFSIQ